MIYEWNDRVPEFTEDERQALRLASIAVCRVAAGHPLATVHEGGQSHGDYDPLDLAVTLRVIADGKAI